MWLLVQYQQMVPAFIFLLLLHNTASSVLLTTHDSMCSINRWVHFQEKSNVNINLIQVAGMVYFWVWEITVVAPLTWLASLHGIKQRVCVISWLTDLQMDKITCVCVCEYVEPSCNHAIIGALQSCVGTRARLDYATFDAHLRKVYFVTVHYTYVCAHICNMLVTMCLRIRSSWYEYAWFKITKAMPRYAWAMQAPMHTMILGILHTCRNSTSTSCSLITCFVPCTFIWMSSSK